MMGRLDLYQGTSPRYALRKIDGHPEILCSSRQSVSERPIVLPVPIITKIQVSVKPKADIMSSPEVFVSSHAFNNL
jgi:hypothetical protein